MRIVMMLVGAIITIAGFVMIYILYNDAGVVLMILGPLVFWFFAPHTERVDHHVKELERLRKLNQS